MNLMLSVESGDNDAFYRIQRADRGIVYVAVFGEDFLPGHARNHGPTVLAELEKLDEWNTPWTTLTIHVGKGTTRCDLDRTPVPSVPKTYLLDEYPVYRFESLRLVRKHKSRTSEVEIDGNVYFLKIARFPHEIPYVIQELQSYHGLIDCPVTAKLVGYVYETHADRVIGFLAGKLEGRVPNLGDLEACKTALDTLHHYLIHGDLVKYNIVVTQQGPKFIDFEDSVLQGTDAWSSSARDAETKILEAKLADESGAGRPW
ncbi:hypothetical protein SPBR_04421 [Sporothrix brasiliensis 5110]|uniref:non-specific serine/threonine protein kinase n=1 Tax=Sporothrix brasiliensis 5110 TaxID=1398154 RepID=A0A0C2FRB0_9PEZI|nr:uncharacterized protein SPBR_04421 [Sporothrix brasiliensis 5110]KIH93553.1 hypothetical protein SPBR_04421 [Sporothrix brasiliensis 5110]